ncbi:uncharacterized protein Z518_09030 [Rhinocladiella mackenziei CBS 650.93]|uniref:Rhinocladiella mackenziei CBS 650.93 unplaced genomic scaffold supercont1.7, whole genome shotgun sequence n=1 Tax=Rhinocladiella mackenziei CBS 650.93 TaxID=1442369 RepID=A0A0D2IXI1_9EURO|nr:uncharacterized protein Z518_09030 [Rhinocladiella mackenziei CBS 650.93]KIX01305.1 hypothetical protein Z518_09030 [Rhinocladiella mackenziei CBS 650.93]
MSPSIFNNEYSRGPLYQYWKERGQEEKVFRDQRVEEAKLRSKGFRPLSPTFGPSSNDQYTNRATSGPPTYRNDQNASAVTSTSASEPTESSDDMLPSYGEVTTRETEPTLHSTEEKARLRENDAALAQRLQNEEAHEGHGKQPERRKSTAGKIGRWLADAASGYTKKQERW